MLRTVVEDLAQRRGQSATRKCTRFTAGRRYLGGYRLNVTIGGAQTRNGDLLEMPLWGGVPAKCVAVLSNPFDALTQTCWDTEPSFQPAFAGLRGAKGSPCLRKTLPWCHT
mmetsp:Transcript_90396/g.156574  ORF Transcript_90396/g.156574 Transcript_90396/m.156574 type:complete len:111 (-) Transcript_90396:641-973(-)